MLVKSLSTNIAIIGGGPAGYTAAIRASQLGANVVLIEENEIGGVCLNRGCIPTKTLLKTSDVAYLIKKSKEFGIESSIKDINWNVAYDRKNRVVKNLKMGLDHLLESRKINIIKGRGVINNPNQVSVTTDTENIVVNFEKLIITTGSKPFFPNIPGIELNSVITSTEALGLKEIPKSIVVIGAGVIGLEFASMFNSIGTKVTIIELQDRILPNEDVEVTAELLKILKRQGIVFKLSSMVKEIRYADEGLSVVLQDTEKEFIVNTDKVLVAVGRKLNTESQDIKSLGLEIKNGAIVVNEAMETNIKNIYAAGDVTGGKLLAHLAFAEGKVAAENALGIMSKVNYNAVPSCVYTNPEIASVGMNEEEALKQSIEVSIGRFNFRNNGRSLSHGERDGFVKIIVDKETNTIIGGQILGTNASEMISEITLAVTLKAKADIIADMIHPHPTLSEAVWEACSDAIGRSIHKA